jgi:hypothetical protein
MALQVHKTAFVALILSLSYSRNGIDAFVTPISPSASLQKPSLTRHYNWLSSLFPGEKSEQQKSERERNFPEQYPATLELGTLKVSSDNYDARLVRPLLKGTSLEERPLKIAYEARRNGWTPADFHKAVDGKGPAVVLAKASGGWLGAYNPKGWAGTGGARPSVAAFLFYTSKATGKFQKLRKLAGGGLACAKDDPTAGIWMGADGLVIPLENRGRTAMSKLGTYYEKGPEDLSSLFGNELETNLSELKVLVGVYNATETIPYSGAVMDFTSG